MGQVTRFGEGRLLAPTLAPCSEELFTKREVNPPLTILSAIFIAFHRRIQKIHNKGGTLGLVANADLRGSLICEYTTLHNSRISRNKGMASLLRGPTVVTALGFQRTPKRC